MVLVLQLTPVGLLVPYLEITQSKRKQTYFLKREPQMVTEHNYKDLLIPGDMAPNPIEELAVLVEDVSSPTSCTIIQLLSNGYIPLDSIH